MIVMEAVDKSQDDYSRDKLKLSQLWLIRLLVLIFEMFHFVILLRQLLYWS